MYVQASVGIMEVLSFKSAGPLGLWACAASLLPFYHHLSLPFDHPYRVLFLPSLPCTFDLRSSILEFHSLIFLFPWPQEVVELTRGGGSRQAFPTGGGRISRPWSARIAGQGSLGPPRPPRSEPRAPKSDPRPNQDPPRPIQDPPRATQDPLRDAQEPPRAAQDHPKRTQDRRKSSQERSKTPQDLQKTSQDTPRTLQNDQK